MKKNILNSRLLSASGTNFALLLVALILVLLTLDRCTLSSGLSQTPRISTEIIENSKSSISKNDNTYNAVEIQAQPAKLYLESTEEGSVQRPSLKVLALFDTHDTKLASAVIYSEKYGAYRYRVGEFLVDQALLTSIQADSVTIHTGTHSYLYTLEPLGVAPGLEESPAYAASPHEELGEEHLTQDQITKRTLLARADLRPVQPGAPEGYIVGGKISPELAGQLGIEPGDIIVSINGHPVGEDANDHLAWLSVQALGTATALLRRGTDEITLHRAMHF